MQKKRGFDETASIYLLPVIDNCEKLRLEIDDEAAVTWDFYKNCREEVLFQILKF